MSRILLADDSPHAQRMGERILLEEGFEVVTVTDGETALFRLADVDPDLIMVDVLLPHKSGYEICRHVKNHPKHRHTRVVLLASPLEPIDEVEAALVRADGMLRKPFEASAVLETVRPLVEASQLDRGHMEPQGSTSAPEPAVVIPREFSEIDRERVRAAVTLALDAALPTMIDQLTERVLVALSLPQDQSNRGGAEDAEKD